MDYSTIPYNLRKRYKNLDFPMCCTPLRLADGMKDGDLRKDIIDRRTPRLNGKVAEAIELNKKGIL